MTELVKHRAKSYEYLMEDESEQKKAKGTKKCVIKRQLMFEIYKDCLFNDKIILRSRQVFRSDPHEMYTKEINKTALSSNNDMRLQIFDKITTITIWNKCF